MTELRPELAFVRVGIRPQLHRLNKKPILVKRIIKGVDKVISLSEVVQTLTFYIIPTIPTRTVGFFSLSAYFSCFKLFLTY
jgi:hypothetical protein